MTSNASEAEVITEQEIQRRDRILREYFQGKDWGGDTEFSLMRKLVLSSQTELSDYPYLFDYEWLVDPDKEQEGKGDLVFTDGRNAFAIVETKAIHGGGKPTDKRNKVEAQARKYGKAFGKRYPSATVELFVYTDDKNYPGLRNPDDRSKRSLKSRKSMFKD